MICVDFEYWSIAVVVICVLCVKVFDLASVNVADAVCVVVEVEVFSGLAGEYSGAEVEMSDGAILVDWAVMYSPVRSDFGHIGRCRVAMAVCVL